MKTLIITPRQLKAINEDSSLSQIVGKFDGTIYGLNTAKTQSMADIQKNGGVGTVVNQNNPTGGTIAYGPQTTPQEVAKAGKVMLTADNTTNQASTFSESCLTKRQVELARLLEMRKNGKVYTKKQLNEMFMETQENAEN